MEDWLKCQISSLVKYRETKQIKPNELSVTKKGELLTALTMSNILATHKRYVNA